MNWNLTHDLFSFSANRLIFAYNLINCGKPKDLSDEDIDTAGLGKVLASYKWVRCSFTYFESPSAYYLHSLSYLA